MIYIFDIDGTLTPSRNIIDKKFKEDFINFCKHHKVWLVTGSDKDKSIEQLGEDAFIIDTKKKNGKVSMQATNDTLLLKEKTCTVTWT